MKKKKREVEDDTEKKKTQKEKNSVEKEEVDWRTGKSQKSHRFVINRKDVHR